VFTARYELDIKKRLRIVVWITVLDFVLTLLQDRVFLVSSLQTAKSFICAMRREDDRRWGEGMREAATVINLVLDLNCQTL
jgi:hypothetical protein